MITEPTYPEYGQLRADAEALARQDGARIDPRKVYRAQSGEFSWEWSVSVLGHDQVGQRLSKLDLYMLCLAADRRLDPPPPAWLVQQRQAAAVRREAELRAAAARQAALDEQWLALRYALEEQAGAKTLVAYNYSGGRHLESYQSGAVHIILTADLQYGRIRRAAGEALCTTDGTRPGQIFHPDPADDRRATCATCLNTAARIAGGAEVGLLVGASRRRGG